MGKDCLRGEIPVRQKQGFLLISAKLKIGTSGFTLLGIK